jgi:VIT1/CCC1 family predicted Fe2+/Mn2+ transporter
MTVQEAKAIIETLSAKKANSEVLSKEEMEQLRQAIHVISGSFAIIPE